MHMAKGLLHAMSNIYKVKKTHLLVVYSTLSAARTLMARLSRLLQTRS